MSDAESPHDSGDDAVIGTALLWSLLVIGTAIAIGAGVWWWRSTEVIESVEEEDRVLPTRRFDTEAVRPPVVTWTDITEQSGIDFVHENGAAGDKLLPESMGGGCAMFDPDNDGDLDLFFVNSKHWDDSREQPTSKLYLNDGTGSFTDATTKWGLDLVCYGMGVAVGDYNGDGLDDLYVTTLQENILLKNSGSRFENVTPKSGTAGDDRHWSTSAIWIDYDRDNDLDLFVCNYVGWSREYDRNQEFRLVGDERGYGRPQFFPGQHPYLFRNNGDETFTEVAGDAGLHLLTESVGDEKGRPMAKSLGVASLDANGDAWPDLLVANDTVQNMLFVNQRDGTFREEATLLGVAFDPGGMARGAMGVDTARFRNNDELGIAIGNFANEMTALYVTPEAGQVFTDEAIASGLGPQTRLQLTFAVLFLDYDLDGRLDLFAANGHLEEDIARVQSSQTYEQPPQLFWNAGAGTGTEFIPVREAEVGTEFLTPLVGRGAASGDIDGDGDLDLLIATVGQAPRLLRNDLDARDRSLRIRLVDPKHRPVLGARMTLLFDDGTTQLRQIETSRGYLSSSEPVATFGIPEGMEPVAVQIRWSDGGKQRMEVAGSSGLLTIERTDDTRP